MQLCEKWSLEFNDRMPIYRQVVLQFSRAFVRGDIQLGERIPSIRDLSVLLKVNTNTVQRAYQEMERDSLITSRRGTGYFITEERTKMEDTRKSLVHDSLRRFLEDMRAIGCSNKDILDELKNYMKGDEILEHAS